MYVYSVVYIFLSPSSPPFSPPHPLLSLLSPPPPPPPPSSLPLSSLLSSPPLLPPLLSPLLPPLLSPLPLSALLDRRWAEDKRRQVEERQNEDVVFAEGTQIASNINRLAKKRTDIFGREETGIGLEVGVAKCTCGCGLFDCADTCMHCTIGFLIANICFFCPFYNYLEHV